MLLILRKLHTTVSIRIVADCVALSCQVARKLKRATALNFTTISAIIFIHPKFTFIILQYFKNKERKSGIRLRYTLSIEACQQ